MNKIVIAYIPVIHRGYIDFLLSHADLPVFLLGDDVRAEFSHLRKDLRALTAPEAKLAIEALGVERVKILDQAKITELQNQHVTLIAPDEDILHELFEKYFPHHKQSFVSVFLRWDKQNVLKEKTVSPDEVISKEELHRAFMKKAKKSAEKSADWWRQVGAIIVKDDEILFETINQHVPSSNKHLFDGDPRGNFHKGEYIELTTAMHAEAAAIAEAARKGVSLDGASIYVTTFPCPNCAKLIAYSGIHDLYYQDGYAMVDGESILKQQNVKIYRVDNNT